MSKIRELLGLAADATEDAVETAVQTLTEKASADAQQVTTLSEGFDKATGLLVSVREALTLSEDTDDDAVVVRVQTLAEDMHKLTKQARERDVDALLDEAVRAGKVAPATKATWRTQLLSENADVAEGAKALLAIAPKVVPLGERKAAPGTDSVKDYGTRLDERTKQIETEQKVSYGDALVLAEQELAQADGAA